MPRTKRSRLSPHGGHRAGRRTIRCIVAADPFDYSEQALGREASALRERLEDVTARLKRAIGNRAAFVPRRVLLVEDQAETRATLTGLIVRLGHEVRAVGNGLDGLLMLQRFHPDVAMIDLAMPGLDGYTIARRIKAALGNESPVLIAYSGHDGAAIRAAALAAGFDHHVAHPIPVDQLMLVLQPQQPT